MNLMAKIVLRHILSNLTPQMSAGILITLIRIANLQ